MKTNTRYFLKAILFLGIVLACDLLLRAGFIGFILPIPIHGQVGGLIFYSLFAALALYLTYLFSKGDNITLSDLGISLNKPNRIDFFIGLLIGIIFWAIVSGFQAWFGGFSWTTKGDILPLSLLYGLVFIFIADLGTELFTRGYALTRFNGLFGPLFAVSMLCIFVGARSFSPNVSGELLLYSMLIPILHTIFFSIIYLKTKRLGGALGIHTGANFVTISIFDLDGAQEGELIPHGFLQPNVELGELSMYAIQMPFVCGAILFSIMVFFLWPTS